MVAFLATLGRLSPSVRTKNFGENGCNLTAGRANWPNLFGSEEGRLGISVYLNIFRADRVQRIASIRAGVKTKDFEILARRLGVGESQLLKALGIRRSASAVRYPPAPSERMIGLMTLVSQVEAMTRGAVPGEFNAAKWLGSWLNSPLPALAGATPSSYLDTMLGQELVASLIAMAESGAYA